LRIGLDFDNTIACYDHVFTAAARDRGYLADKGPLNKLEVRARVRALDGGEQKWMALQGEVYGKRMKDAALMPGVADFFTACKTRAVNIFIVSHKTSFGHFDENRVNLRDAACTWMQIQGFFDPDGFALENKNVYFNNTRLEKIARIADLDCTHFIDDLKEVFAEPSFPARVVRILYDPISAAPKNDMYDRHTDWKSIEHTILG